MPDEIDLTGQVAVVTGATRGIGRETALALGRAGAKVVLVGRSREGNAKQVLPGTLESVTARLIELGAVARWVQADLTDPSSTATVVDQTPRASGHDHRRRDPRRLRAARRHHLPLTSGNELARSAAVVP